MIIGLAKRIVFGVIRKVVSLVILVVLAIWAFFHQDTVKIWYNNVVGVFTSKYQIDVQTDDGDFTLTLDGKKAIDQWLFANKLNEYGDPVGTMYTGGTPLFDEATGESIDKYDYIISKHPELKSLIK